jgi:hypothetical protein
MITTITSAFLFALVIAAGVLILMSGMSNEKYTLGNIGGKGGKDDGSTDTTFVPSVKKLNDIKKQNVMVGGGLISVGVIGLVLTGFVASSSGSVASSNFGFRFY